MFLWLGELCFALAMDRFLQPKHRRTMWAILVILMLLIVQEVWEYWLSTDDVPRIQLRTAVSVFGYVLRPVIPVLFMRIASERERHPLAWSLVGVNALVYLISPATHLAFWIDETNHYQGGPLSTFCLIISLLLLADLLRLSILEMSFGTRRLNLIPIGIVLFIVGAYILDHRLEIIDYPVNLSLNAVVAGCNLYYVWLAQSFLRAHEKALREEQQIELMMSQIQPHFLYNTLSTIQALCRIDPEKAFTTTEKFGAYLRQNLDSLNTQAPIPLSVELEHTRTYAQIEQIRFPNIQVRFNIMDESFVLPALTVQPLVENAIRHGIRGREDGTVWVTTFQESNAHVIVIRDNGVGFEPEMLEESRDGEAHLGIRVVRERLMNLVQGALKVESQPGKGTRVTIRIPKQEREKGGRAA